MSTRPYATHGGVRIRQRYNKAIIRYREWYKAREPTGCLTSDWFLWKRWVRDREEQMMADRNEMIKQAEDKQRRLKRNGTTPERRHGAAASAATNHGDSGGARSGEPHTDAAAD